MKLLVPDDHLLIYCDNFVEKKGSIFMPQAHSERSRKATVLLCGPDANFAKPGDRVIVSFHAGVHPHLFDEKIDVPELGIVGQEIDEERHRICREHEILAKITEE